MRLADIRPFLREVVTDLGFTEWPDGFNFENIPENISEKAYHILTPSGDGGPISMHDQQVSVVNQIRIFRKGFRDPGEAIDTIMSDLDNVICDLFHPEHRFNGHLNITLDGFEINPLSDSNDNSVVATLNVNVKVTLGVT